MKVHQMNPVNTDFSKQQNPEYSMKQVCEQQVLELM